MNQCPKCDSKNIVMIEYWYTHPERYDGVSEYECKDCGYRQGRWSGKELKGDEYEKRYGGI